jgi:parallel beta-helix repeat protein
VKRLVPVIAAACFVLVLPLSAFGDPPSVVCGQTVMSDVTLNEDLVCSGTALTVGAGGVTIDLDGHEIQGDGSGVGVFVFLDVTGDVAVRDGAISGFGSGIVALRGNLRVTHMNISANEGSGISVAGMGHSRESRLTLTDSNVHHNEFGVGICTFLSRQNVITGNNISHNERGGLSACFDSGGLIADNRFTHNGGNGLSLQDSYSDIIGNVFSDNARNGLFLTESIGGAGPLYTVKDNVADGNGELGISLVFAAPPGFVVQLADGSGNSAKRNGDDRQCLIVVCAKNRGGGR